MKVTLINTQERKSFLKDYGQFACICYDTNEKYAQRVGKHCLESGHFSGSRHLPFVFKIEGISRAISMQLIRHTTGVTVNQQSQRYVPMNEFGYVIPPRIAKNEKALAEYLETMYYLGNKYQSIQQYLLDDGCTKEQANENARYVLPNSCHTELNMSFTLEALINLAHKRLCIRSQDEIRELVKEMCNKVIEIIPELKPYLVAICDEVGYCKESHSCGRKPKKNEVLNGQ